MNQYLDRITEAYNGDLGEKMKINARKRIDWIITNAKGGKILDVGCSQGIVSIILARLGFKSIGIDMAEESISYALDCLRKEDALTRENARFICSDYLLFQSEEEYDTVIMTEVLEHVIDPLAFIEKAKNSMHQRGRLIVTVPFGINDWPEHKRTYYLADIYELISQSFYITNVEFFGKWIGFVAEASLSEAQITVAFDLALLRVEEKHFYIIERELVDIVKNSSTREKELNTKYKKSTEEEVRLKSELEKLNEENKQNARELNDVLLQNTALLKKYDELCKQCDSYAFRTHELISENDKSISLLLSAQKELQNLRIKCNILEKRNSEFQSKLSIIYNTWYGRLLLSFFKLLKKIKRLLFR